MIPEEIEKLTLEYLDHFYIILDQYLTVFYVSTNTSKYISTINSKLIGQPISKIMYPDDLIELIDILNNLKKSQTNSPENNKKTFLCYCRLRVPSRKSRNIFAITPGYRLYKIHGIVDYQNGELIHVLGKPVFIDETVELPLNEHIFVTLMDIDTMTILYQDQRAAKYVGYELDEVKGVKATVFLHTSFLHILAPAFALLFEKGESMTGEYLSQTKYGWIWLRSRTSFYDSGNIHTNEKGKLMINIAQVLSDERAIAPVNTPNDNVVQHIPEISQDTSTAQQSMKMSKLSTQDDVRTAREHNPYSYQQYPIDTTNFNQREEIHPEVPLLPFDFPFFPTDFVEDPDLLLPYQTPLENVSSFTPSAMKETLRTEIDTLSSNWESQSEALNRSYELLPTWSTTPPMACCLSQNVPTISRLLNTNPLNETVKESKQKANNIPLVPLDVLSKQKVKTNNVINQPTRRSSYSAHVIPQSLMSCKRSRLPVYQQQLATHRHRCSVIPPVTSTAIPQEKVISPPSLAPNLQRDVIIPPSLDPNLQRAIIPPSLAPNLQRAIIPPSLAPNQQREIIPPSLAPNLQRAIIPPSLAPNLQRAIIPPSLAPNLQRDVIIPPSLGCNLPQEAVIPPFLAPNHPQGAVIPPFLAPNLPQEAVIPPFLAPNLQQEAVIPPFLAPNHPQEAVIPPFLAPNHPQEAVIPPFLAPNLPQEAVIPPFLAPNLPQEAVIPHFLAPNLPQEAVIPPSLAPHSQQGVFIPSYLLPNFQQDTFIPPHQVHSYPQQMVPASLPASSLTDASGTLRPYQSFSEQGSSFSPYNATYQNGIQNIQTDHSLLSNNNGLFDVSTSRSFYNNETVPYYPDTQQQQQQQQYEPSTYFENPQLFSSNFPSPFFDNPDFVPTQSTSQAVDSSIIPTTNIYYLTTNYQSGETDFYVPQTQNDLIFSQQLYSQMP